MKPWHLHSEAERDRVLIYAPRCVPLTPAAAEFLAAMGGGK